MDDPVIVNLDTFDVRIMHTLDHVHTVRGVCLKNRFGRDCLAPRGSADADT